VTGFFKDDRLLTQHGSEKFVGNGKLETLTKERKYTINLDGKKETSIPLSTYFKNPKTIILETKKESVIVNIDELQVFDGYIYIFDSSKAKSLFVFDLEGSFIRKIGSIGRGPGEYIGIKDITLDMENRIIFLCDSRNRIHKYQFDGTYLHTITIQAPENSAAFFIQFYNDRLYSSHHWWNNSNDDPMLLEIDPNDGKIISSSIPILYNKGWNESYIHYLNRVFMSRANHPPRYNEMFMDYILTIGKEITPYIELKSKHLTNETDIESFRGKEGHPINFLNLTNSKKLFNVQCFIENDDFICFRFGESFPFVVIYYKETGEVKLANYLSNDLIYRKDTRGMVIIH